MAIISVLVLLQTHFLNAFLGKRAKRSTIMTIDYYGRVVIVAATVLLWLLLLPWRRATTTSRAHLGIV